MRPCVGDLLFKLNSQEIVENDAQEAPLWTYTVAMTGTRLTRLVKALCKAALERWRKYWRPIDARLATKELQGTRGFGALEAY